MQEMTDFTDLRRGVLLPLPHNDSKIRWTGGGTHSPPPVVQQSRCAGGGSHFPKEIVVVDKNAAVWVEKESNNQYPSEDSPCDTSFSAVASLVSSMEDEDYVWSNERGLESGFQSFAEFLTYSPRGANDDYDDADEYVFGEIPSSNASGFRRRRRRRPLMRAALRRCGVALSKCRRVVVYVVVRVSLVFGAVLPAKNPHKTKRQ